MQTTAIAQWFSETYLGFILLSAICSLFSIVLIQQMTRYFKGFVQPIVEKTFYSHILNRWLGPFLSKHKIVANAIRLLGLGDSIVDIIVHLIGTFVVVAFLSSSLTAIIIHTMHNGFFYSLYLLWLISMASMLLWVLIHNMIYFYRISMRLK